MAVGLLDLCEQYFGARDFYEVLKVSKNCNEKQIKKAYHKLSLLVHPDRVEEEIKVEATEKFKVLGRIHSILSDNDKRKIYDETGQFDEENEEVVMQNWSDYWRSLFKEITVEDINNYEKNYKGSETEIKDLKRAYMDHNGDMDTILELVPFTNCAEEPRLHAIIQDLIKKGEVPEFKEFTEEDEKKKLRRKRKWEKEAKQAEKMEKKRKIERKGRSEGTDDLALAILNRNNSRASQAENFFDSLIDKYTKASEKPKKKSATSKGSKKKKWEKEARQAERLERKLQIEREEAEKNKSNLTLAVLNQNQFRESQADNFFDSLINKYTKAAGSPQKKTATFRSSKIRNRY